MLGVVESERRSCCRGNFEVGHQWLGAVMPGANGNTLVIEQRAEIVWMHVSDDEGDDPDALLCRADDAQAFDCLQCCGCVEQQLVFSML